MHLKYRTIFVRIFIPKLKNCRSGKVSILIQGVSADGGYYVEIREIKNTGDEIAKTINTTETTQDKTETSKEDDNIQKKTTDIQKKTVTEKADKKEKTEKVEIPTPVPTVQNDIIKTQKAEESVQIADADLIAEEIEVNETEATEAAVETVSETAEETTQEKASDALTETTEVAPVSGGGGGGGSASAFSARRMVVLEMKVSIENIEKTNETALKYAPMQSGVYTMSKEKLQLLLKDLEAQGIGVSFPEIGDEEISFTVTAG